MNNQKYKKADICFDKCIEANKEISVAYYGKAVLYSLSSFNNFSLDSAYYFTRKGEVLFYELSKEKQNSLNKKYGISFSKYFHLRRNITIETLDNIDNKDIEALQLFLDVYGDEKYAEKAQSYIDEIIHFQTINHGGDISYYKMLIDKYPNNDSINKIWQFYYDLYTSDGKLLTLVKFKISHQNFPYKDSLEADMNIAGIVERNKLLNGKTPQNTKFYNEYIKQAAPKYQAFQVLLVFIKKEIDNKDWAKALDIINMYKDDFKDNIHYKNLIEILETKDYDIVAQQISDRINSNGHEFSPVINASGNKLYFGGLNRSDNIGGEDIFVAELIDGQWQNAKILDGVNSQYGNEAPDGISIDETKLLLFINGDIYISNISQHAWSKPKMFPVINTREWEGDGVFTADGKAILFASESWEKQGIQFPSNNRHDNFDIYVSTLNKDGEWSVPINLGTTINTPYCDRYPFLHPDMKTLYFSSEGHGGLGGTDVFMSQRLCDSAWDKWSEPINLGKNINTSGNDNGYKISTDGDFAFFSRMKENINIYSVQLPSNLRPNKVIVVNGIITDETGQVIEAKINVEDLITGKSYGEFFSHPSTGEYTMTLPSGKEYGYYVSKKFYFPTSYNLDLRNSLENDIIDKNLTITSIKSMIDGNTPITINNIFFDSDKTILKPESFAELNRIAEIIKNSPNYIFTIEGHTDNLGNSDYNIELSLNRAQSVIEYLYEKGCNKQQIKSKGYGASKPKYDNVSDESRAGNRRVEIRMTKK